ncbi:O-antigen ligase family protein [Monaibacterium marinum]|nr:O-antigen ligase family protein [Monaibacterium marinum]
MVAILIALALSPLPLGSNRPVFWAFGALIAGLGGAIYFGSFALRGERIRISTPWMKPAIILGGLYLGWLIVQILPLGLMLGGFETALPSGLVITTNTLSLTPGATTVAALRVAGYGMVFMLVLQIAGNRDRAKYIAQMLVFIVVGWALYGLLALIQFDDTILLFEKWAYLGSATGPFVNRNSFATFLAMGMITCLGLAADRATRRNSMHSSSVTTRLTDASTMHIYLMILIGLVLLATILQTNSRMGVFAGLIGTGLTTTLILARRLGLGRGTLLLVPVILIIVGSLSAWLYGGTLVDRLGGVEQDANVRLAVYRQVLDMIAQRPVVGWGADSFEVVYRAFRAPPVSPEFSWARAHSTYLAHWSETGILFGSIPLLLVGAAFFACLIAALRRDSDIVLPAIGAGVIATGATHSLVDFSLEMQANVWLFLALVALALGGHKASSPVAHKAAEKSAAAGDPAIPAAQTHSRRRKRRRRS